MAEVPDLARGVHVALDGSAVLYAPYFEEQIERYAVPTERQMRRRAQISLSRGEYEPMVFVLHASRELSNVTFSFEPSKSQGRKPYPARFIDVRRMCFIPECLPDNQFRWLPGPLERGTELSLAKGENAIFWCTVYLPESLPAGTYGGTVSCYEGEQLLAQKDYTVTAMDFRLPPPQRCNGVFLLADPWNYQKRYPRLKGFGLSRPETWEQDFKVLRAYGFNRLFLYDYAPALKHVGEKLELAAPETFGRLLDMAMNAGFERDAFYLYLNPGSSVRYAQKYGKNDLQVLQDTVRAIEKFTSEKGVKIRYYTIGEEATVSPRRYKALHEMEGIRTICVDNGRIIRNHYSVANRSFCERWGDRIDAFMTNFFMDDCTRVSWASVGKRPFFYNLGNAGGDCNWRVAFGLIPERFDAAGHFQWAFNWCQDDPFFHWTRNNWSVTYPGVDGPLPGKALECAREGIDDARYMDLLKRLIAQAAKSPDRHLREQAELAMADFRKILSQVPKYRERDLNAFPKVAQIHGLNVAMRDCITGHILKFHSLRGTASIPSAGVTGQSLSVSVPEDDYRQVPHCFKRRTNPTDAAAMVWVPAPKGKAGICSGFWMYQNEVTMVQWRRFLEQSGYQWKHSWTRPPVWADDGLPLDRILTLPDNHPAISISLEDARAYARWAGGRLPTAEEWEWAAQGPQRVLYPWGNRWKPEYVGFKQGQPPKRIPNAMELTFDRSWCDVWGLASGVREWTETVYYPDAFDHLKIDRSSGYHLLKGGSIYGMPERYQNAGRYYADYSTNRVSLNGFRLIVSDGESSKP